MSNRYTSQSRNEDKNSPQNQKKFIPKRDSQGPNARQTTLSDALRSSSSDVGGSGGDSNDAASASASMSRVRIAGDGEWVSKTSSSGRFVIYLPQDEAVAMGIEPDEGGLDPVESQHVVDLLNRELSRLLKLGPKDFWREVATDESLHAFLESFLKFRSRWYDFPYRGAQGTISGVIVGELELCKRVFLVLYRLSSNKDPGAKAADILSPKDHAVLLQSKKLLDLPKLLDICAIYGHENEDLTRILVMNAIKAQPQIQDDFPVLMCHFLTIIQTMYQRCTLSLEVLLSSAGDQNQGFSHLFFDYLEVMDFINDAVVSMDSFINAYKQSAVFFSCPVETSDENEELLTILSRLHDSLLISLQRGFRVIYATPENRNKELREDKLSNIFVSLKMLSTRIATFGWKLLYFCYLGDEAFESGFSPALIKMFPANVEDPVIRADILIQLLKNLDRDYTHIAEEQSWMPFIRRIEKNHKLMSRIDLLRKTGWISMDNEQFQFLAGILKLPLETNSKAQMSSSLPITSNEMEPDENSIIVESKISQIKELFPDYGRGFLVACLEAYNQDAEEVIQRILEGTLHEELQSLDISLEKTPSSVTAPAVSRYDKGKGKLVESAFPLSETVEHAAVKNQDGVSSSSSSAPIGRFVRKNADELSGFKTLDAKKDKELVKKVALLSQFEYEDEYDDSFDDLGISVGDSESLEDKINTQDTRLTEGGVSSSNTDNSKWGSRKKPLFYVKDGKNYSYKVEGSVAAANYNEARLVNQAQKELIHGLGRGGNIPLGSVKRLEELNEVPSDGNIADEVGGSGRASTRSRGRSGNHSSETKRHPESSEDQKDGQGTNEVGGRGGRGVSRGRGRRYLESNEEQTDGQGGDEVGGRGGRGNARGRGRRYLEVNEEQTDGQGADEVGGRGGRGNGRGGGRRGGGRNHYRQDRAMKKHFSGIPGIFNS